MKTAKKLLCNLIIYVVLMSIMASGVLAASEFTALSASGIVISAATGQVIYSNNEDARFAPGGLTKIMTLYMASEGCENGQMSRGDIVTITDRMLAESDAAYIKEGNEFTVEQLMYMTHFDVDPTAARALAVYMDVTEEQFAKNMTKAAGVLGCTDTSFRNADGRQDENQYTTAHDMARIIISALKNELFRTIFSSHMYILPKDEGGVETTILTKNELQVRSSPVYSEYCIGGKASLETDTVNSAAAVGESQDAEFEVIAVAVNGNSMSDIFSDLKNMLAWSSENYKLMTVLKAGESLTSVPVAMGVEAENVYAGPSGDMSFLVTKDSDKSDFSVEIKQFNDGVRAPVDKGDVLGEIIVSYRGQEYGRIGLTANKSISLDKRAFTKNEVKESLLSPVSIIIFVLIIAAVVLYFLYAMKYRKQLEEEKRERRVIMQKLAEDRRKCRREAEISAPQSVPHTNYYDLISAVKNAAGVRNEDYEPAVDTYPPDGLFAGFFTEDAAEAVPADKAGDALGHEDNYESGMAEKYPGKTAKEKSLVSAK